MLNEVKLVEPRPLKPLHLKTMPYQIVTISEKELWNEYVHASKMYDFYHSWYYHSLERTGDPILFVYHQPDCFIAFPLLRRTIKGTSCTDFTSVYGYAGPICNKDFAELDEETMLNFKRAFLTFLKEEKNVSVFSRLHPIINHDVLLQKFGGLCDHGRTVAIDLRCDIEEQRKKYRRQFRSKIRQLRDKGYYLKEATSRDEVREYVKIYNANMARVHAESYYHFNEDYFFNMLDSNDFESSVLLLYDGDTITSGAFVAYSNNIMQFHLAATAVQYLHEGPMKLLIDEATLAGRQKGMNYLHLGGGVGGNEDSLFEFKAGFSDTYLDFKTWRFITEEKVYNDLVEQRWKNQLPAADFFPLYRESSGTEAKAV